MLSMEFYQFLLTCCLIYSALATSNQQCPPGEVYAHKMNQCQKCEDQYSGCDQKPPFKDGCDCPDGLYRDKSGKCIPANKCPQKCKKDEQYYTNKPDCKNTCENCDNNAVLCPIGKPGCFCKEGLVKRKDGKCVKPEDCGQSPEKCKKDEQYYTNKPDCKNTCENCDNNAVLCPIGKPGCFCKKGLVKRKDGKCVKPEDCGQPPNTCGPNEEYLECGTACPDTCDDKRPKACTLQCVCGCFCKQGYIREKKGGKCIPKSQCPSDNCGPNEEFLKYGPPCPPTCDDRKPKCRIQIAYISGCFCKKGYIREKKGGKCIPESQCPPPRPQCSLPYCKPGCHIDYTTKPCPSCKCFGDAPCGPNSHYTNCASLCPRKCNEKPKFCPAVCVKGCVCNDGYINDGNGCCIPENQCPPNGSNCGKNEKYLKCGTACPLTCDNKKPGPCTYNCVSGCFCKDGFIRDKKGGRCIPESQCPPDGVCSKPGEVYKKCGSPCEATCFNQRFHDLNKCPIKCKPGCFCKDGLVRDSKGNCIEPNQCSNNNVCKKHEYYSKCGTSCQPSCANPDPWCTYQCAQGCFCEKGYIREKDGGKCIPKTQCHKN